jgi:hypothetical protein
MVSFLMTCRLFSATSCTVLHGWLKLSESILLNKWEIVSLCFLNVKIGRWARPVLLSVFSMLIWWWIYLNGGNIRARSGGYQPIETELGWMVMIKGFFVIGVSILTPEPITCRRRTEEWISQQAYRVSRKSPAPSQFQHSVDMRKRVFFNSPIYSLSFSATQARRWIQSRNTVWTSSKVRSFHTCAIASSISSFEENSRSLRICFNIPRAKSRTGLYLVNKASPAFWKCAS